jgi:fatty-acyl-CoA synthase
MALSAVDRVLPVVPMFHVNAWGIPYGAMMVGASLVMPDRFLQAEPLARLIATARVTLAGAVPTIWSELLRYVDTHPTDLSSMRMAVCGGAPVPRSLMEAFESRHRVRVLQAWGMTETSPLGCVARPPVGTPPDQEWAYRTTAGRLLCGVEGRIVGVGGEVLPRDGKAVGEIEVRGPWITGAYYRDDDPTRFDDGWLRTGDVGSIDPRGFMTITDRAKDVIKSGGEWISSVDLENALMAHPDVVEAAVVAVPDDRWQERPLATVVLRDGATVTMEELRRLLEDHVAHWQVPERWAFIAAVPRTSVGKFDKKTIRRQYAHGTLPVQTATAPPRPRAT